MTKNSIFLTTASIGEGTGGGSVSFHELNALKSKTNVLAALDAKDLNPVNHQLPWNEFLQDYLALEKTKALEADILFTNGNPFGMTCAFHAERYFANGDGRPGMTSSLKLIADCPAHDLAESIKEYESITGMKYAPQYPHMVDPFLWKMYTAHLKNADVIISPSKYSVNELKKIVTFDERLTRFEVIPHGCPVIDDVKPYPATFRVGHAGQFGSDKGNVYLILAWLKLNYKDASCVVAGEGSEAFKKTAKDIAKAHFGMQEEKEMPPFQILGYLPDINVFYRNISVLVQPSVTEGFGMSVLEAMMHARPVIVSDGAGASELVEHGKSGFVFPKRDVGKLAEHIQYFKDNPSEIAKFGAKARETAMNYTWDKVEARIARVIEAV